MVTRGTLPRQFGYIRLIAGILAGLPLLVLPVLGLIWIWQSDARLHWLASLGVCAVMGYGLHMATARRNRTSAELDAIQPNPDWSPSAEACWQEVERLAGEVTPQEWPIENVEKMALLGRNTLDHVARHYHPEASQPLLEMTIPHALLIFERASRDLRTEIVQAIPFSHSLTMGLLLRLNRWRETAMQFETLFRAGRAVVSPYSALVHEVRRNIGGSIAQIGLDNLKTWLLREYVRKVGFYGIELYSGQLTLADHALTEKRTTTSAEDMARAQEHADRISTQAEPLRVLVLGRTNAGKSSLINALSGNLVAVTDAEANTTRDVTAFRLELPENDAALILDAPGIEPGGLDAKKLKRLALDADLILWVTPAVARTSSPQADRHAERKTLDQIRAWYAQAKNRRMPPLVAVLSHIDLLPPEQEWSPPYDHHEPATPKAVGIANAVQVAATDLLIPEDLVVPVSLKPDNLYNVDDTLITVLEEVRLDSEKARLLRCLEARKQEERMAQLKEQAVNVGRKLRSVLPWGKGR